MSEHNPNHDPIDKAYAEAEALLSDDAARAARRAKLLAAVATEAAPVLEPPRRSSLPRAVWLTAAGIAGVALVLASQAGLTNRFRVQTPPTEVQPPPLSTAPSLPPAQPPAATTRATPTAPSAEARPPAQASAAPRAFPAEATPPEPAPPSPPPISIRSSEKVIPPPPPPSAPAATYGSSAVAGVVNFRTAPEALPAPEPGPPLPPIAVKPVEKFVAPPPPPRSAPPPPPPPRSAAPAAALLAAPPAASPQGAARSTNDPAGALRGAAAAGRVAEVEALLAQGAVVDAPDEGGNTALMESIQANHPDVVAALRRRGASLDVKNRAGQSARDMAAVIGDAKLNEALGLPAPMLPRRVD